MNGTSASPVLVAVAVHADQGQPEAPGSASASCGMYDGHLPVGDRQQPAVHLRQAHADHVVRRRIDHGSMLRACRRARNRAPAGSRRGRARTGCVTVRRRDTPCRPRTGPGARSGPVPARRRAGYAADARRRGVVRVGREPRTGVSGGQAALAVIMVAGIGVTALVLRPNSPLLGKGRGPLGPQRRGRAAARAGLARGPGCCSTNALRGPCPEPDRAPARPTNVSRRPAAPCAS